MAEKSTLQLKTKDRVIRVFISSTFQDMHAERERLVKYTFPELRSRCRERGVEFVDVDLRWGVTDEQKAEGKVLPICLAEIERCRPFFIGLLGERYGWVPEEIDEGLLEDQEWLNQHKEKSVTELEILHGVLEIPDIADHAFFYFRDIEKSKQIEKELVKDPDYQKEPDASREKLNTLKEKIKKSGFPVQENYPDTKKLGEMVLSDLWQAIDQRFPAKEVLSSLDREAADHEAFARSRTGVYIERDEYFQRLNEHVNGDGPALIILGESGSGKSALLSNWALKYQEDHPDEFLLLHFIGASAYSADWAAMLRRIMGEFKHRFDIEQEIPDKPDELRASFANWLHMAAVKGRVILILDALNQLEDRDGASDLVWLPPVIPPNIRLILSTLPGRPLDDVIKRNWPTMTVQPLNQEERRSFIKNYLGQYTKELSPVRAEYITQVEQTTNPLYMQALLDELRLFGRHEQLDERINYYLEAETVPDLYEKILTRYEEDYEFDKKGLVQDVMSCIWAARRGLAESELLDILGSDGSPMPRAVWSPLNLAAEHSLVNRSGLIAYSHEYFRQAVQNRYLATADERHAVHLRLADYFNNIEISPRKVDELPWQLARAKEWERLKDLLIQPQFFISAWEANEFDVKAFWAQLEDNSYNMVDMYRRIIKSPVQPANLIWATSILLHYTGHSADALLLRESLVEQYRKGGDKDNLQASLGNQGAILHARGEFDEAIKLYKEQERICRELGNKYGLQASLGNQGLILETRGELDEAMRLYKKQERICRELGNKYGLQASLGNQGAIFYAQGELDVGMKLYKEQERICRELGNKDGLANSLGNQANILYSQGEFDEAMKLYKKQERICRELGNKYGLQASLGNQGTIFYAQGELDVGMKLYKEQERICRELRDKDGLANSLGNQALILKDRGEFDGAMRLYKEHERICRELGSKDGLQASFGKQANVLYARGELDGAMRLYKEQERICRELGNKDWLSLSLGNQALILKARGELDKAMELLRESGHLCRELGNKDGLQASFGKQANILYARGELDEAMRLLKEQERICRELGNKDGLQTSLGDQANILYARGELDNAMRIYKEQEHICMELGNKDGLQVSLGNQGAFYYARREFGRAMKLYEEKVQICKELGNKDGLALAFGSQGVIHYAQGDFDNAMLLYKKQENICKEIEDSSGLVMSLANQGELLAEKMGKLKEALPLVEEAYRLAIENGLVVLGQQIRPILESIQSKLE